MRPKTTRRIRGTTPEIDEMARLFRRNMTPAEKVLWDALKGAALNGLHFRAQHAVGHFVLDFYCPSCKLVVEVDGGIHVCQQNRDILRTEELERYGYRVIRFHNDAVFDDLDGVLQLILAAARGGPPNLPILGGIDTLTPLTPQFWGARLSVRSEVGVIRAAARGGPP